MKKYESVNYLMHPIIRPYNGMDNWNMLGPQNNQGNENMLLCNIMNQNALLPADVHSSVSRVTHQDDVTRLTGRVEDLPLAILLCRCQSNSTRLHVVQYSCIAVNQITPVYT